MIISSEKTGETYKTVEECLEAEKAFDEEQLRKKEEEEKRLSERKQRLEEVNKAKEEAINAVKYYNDVVEEFSRDYPLFHNVEEYTDKNGNKVKHFHFTEDDILGFLNLLL